MIRRFLILSFLGLALVTAQSALASSVLCLAGSGQYACGCPESVSGPCCSTSCIEGNVVDELAALAPATSSLLYQSLVASAPPLAGYYHSVADETSGHLTWVASALNTPPLRRYLLNSTFRL